MWFFSPLFLKVDFLHCISLNVLHLKTATTYSGLFNDLKLIVACDIWRLENIFFYVTFIFVIWNWKMTHHSLDNILYWAVFWQKSILFMTFICLLKNNAYCKLLKTKNLPSSNASSQSDPTWGRCVVDSFRLLQV